MVLSIDRWQRNAEVLLSVLCTVLKICISQTIFTSYNVPSFLRLSSFNLSLSYSSLNACTIPFITAFIHACRLLHLTTMIRWLIIWFILFRHSLLSQDKEGAVNICPLLSLRKGHWLLAEKNSLNRESLDHQSHVYGNGVHRVGMNRRWDWLPNRISYILLDYTSLTQ